MQTLNKIEIIHGDCDYLILKKLNDLKLAFTESGFEIIELFGDSINDQVYLKECFYSSSLFSSSLLIIIRDIYDGKKFFPFIDDLTDIIKLDKFVPFLLIVNKCKILRTSRLLKTSSANAVITEIEKPNRSHLINKITTSMNITSEASEFICSYCKDDMYRIRSELDKPDVLFGRNKKIEKKDIENISSFYSFNINDIWGTGDSMMKYLINPNNKTFANLIKGISDLLEVGMEPMQILYNLYSYTINSIKLKGYLRAGKNFRESLSLGYFFVKNYFSTIKSISQNDLYKINSIFCDYEFDVKSGNINAKLGLINSIFQLRMLYINGGLN